MHPIAAGWTDVVTAVATAVLALGVLGALVAAIFAGQQVREARRSREARMAAEWEPGLRATHGVDAYPFFRDLAARMRER